MALTTSSRFKRIRVQKDITITVEVYYQLSDDTYGKIRLYSKDLASDHADRSALDTLQEIYASDDGFLDVDGNAVEVSQWSILSRAG